jgi:hypothetical protein
MPTYTILTHNTKRDFELYYGEMLAARVVYPKWYSANCLIEVGGKHYELKGQGFWKRKYILFLGEQEVVSYQPGFGKCTITPRMQAHHFYQVKRRATFKSGYKLLNYKDEPLAEFIYTISWKRFRTLYEITLLQGIQPDANMEFLSLVLMVKYGIDMQRAMAAAGTWS